MAAWIYVFLGGGLGSVVRFIISESYNSSDKFPMSTLIANITACLVLGFLIAMQSKSSISQSSSLLLATGFCGGFSTFSTFSAESLKLAQNEQIGLALIYIGVSIVAGLFAVYIGYKIYNQF